MTYIFMFPGQTSRYPEMFERLLRLAPSANGAIVEAASETLSRDLGAHYRSDNPDLFATNRDIQVGVLLANHLFLKSVERVGIRADLSLGLSLGEYNHLVHIGGLAFADALRLVDARGKAYDSGPDGAMAAVFPLEVSELEPVVARARAHGCLEIANLNSPTQHVLSGERAAISAALAILEEEHFVEGVVVEQRIPMHSSRFAPVAQAFKPALERAHWRPLEKPYLPNVLGRFLEPSAPAALVDMLFQHVQRPVRWRESIDFLAERYPDATFIEVGPRAVLYNLLQRSWRPNPRFKTDGDGDLAPWFDVLVRELRREP
jgi:[acyl-carrier-protein] S-malonyltransferase